jgi:hypothetical protein
LDPVTLIDEAFDSIIVSVTDCPDEMPLELAAMETTGVEPAVTVTMVCADAVAPEELVAKAVYVVVVAGDTETAPPVFAMLYFDPSEPETVTEMALEAVTVNVSEDPAVMLLDFGVIETAGFVPGLTVIVV